MDDWLVKRLTPAKAQDDRWVDLARAVQTLWEHHFDPSFARLEALRSIYTLEAADLNSRLQEYGDYFTVDLPRMEDRPIGVAWRKLELEYKDMAAILYSVFKRHFQDLPVEWLHLYAPKSAPYGTEFIPEDQLGVKPLPKDAYFLTSRGMLAVDFGHLKNMGLTKAKFLETAIPLVRRTKPEHIVFDGALFYVTVGVDFGGKKYLPSDATDPDIYWTNRGAAGVQNSVIIAESTYLMHFTLLDDHYDVVPADAKQCDANKINMPGAVEVYWAVPYTQGAMPLWTLDMRLAEGTPEGWLPLDYIRPGREGEAVSDLHLAHAERSRTFGVSFGAGLRAVDPASGRIGLALAAGGVAYFQTVNFEAAFFLADGTPEAIPVVRGSIPFEDADGDDLLIPLRYDI